MRLPALSLALILLASPAAAQIGINGTRQAATTGPIDIALSPIWHCSRSDRRAYIAMAGREARGVERERLMMDYRRLRYAGSGLTEAEEAALDARARQIDAEAGRAYRYSSYERSAHRQDRAGGRRHQSGC